MNNSIFLLVSMLSSTAFGTCPDLSGDYRIANLQTDCTAEGSFNVGSGLPLPASVRFLGTLGEGDSLVLNQSNCSSLRFQYQSTTFGGSVDTDVLGSQDLGRSSSFDRETSLFVKEVTGRIFVDGVHSDYRWNIRPVDSGLKVELSSRVSSLFFPKSEGKISCNLVKQSN